ncbi:hypothetical protein HBI04_030170 [Parastagonospora nodorum]|nr:hypothetical protein HBI04_030170 [Parastagonospora nodorum]KAH4917553.1 hypothetical protein HBI79_220130 [Parastagonospora nodorum]KAH5196573.1 hypothetical protein HBH76_039850 [Parastagonospora nodorum]KAH5279165.1 hypothetical protein HBI71_017920 [Parastagonospora nodorum]KAH5787874.1 hypothetical protein HBI16_008120 [Parastagonospora nodorum]
MRATKSHLEARYRSWAADISTARILPREDFGSGAYPVLLKQQHPSENSRAWQKNNCERRIRAGFLLNTTKLGWWLVVQAPWGARHKQQSLAVKYHELKKGALRSMYSNS